jgi:uncharacterized protein DUF4136
MATLVDTNCEQARHGVALGRSRQALMEGGMYRLKRLLFCAMGAFLAITASYGQEVRYNFDKQADFSKFKTYKWVVLKDATKPNDLLDKQIKAAVDTELAAKGLTKVEDDSANLYVGYQAGIGQEKEFTSYNSGWGYGPGWGGGWYGAGGTGITTGQTNTVYVGQLVVDMYDSAQHDLVWRGLATKTIDTDAKPEKQQKNLTKTVNKLMKNFPPKVKEKS